MDLTPPVLHLSYHLCDILLTHLQALSLEKVVKCSQSKPYTSTLLKQVAGSHQCHLFPHSRKRELFLSPRSVLRRDKLIQMHLKEPGRDSVAWVILNLCAGSLGCQSCSQRNSLVHSNAK